MGAKAPARFRNNDYHTVRSNSLLEEEFNEAVKWAIKHWPIYLVALSAGLLLAHCFWG